MSAQSDSEMVEAVFRRFGEAPGDELAMALLINRALTPDLDVARVRDDLSALNESLRGALTPWQALRAAGFSGNTADYQALNNSCLDWVLQHRRGIPISLGVLLIHVARALGHAAVGVNFPGHFLVRIDDQLVDPFEMEPVTEAACLARLPQPELAQRAGLVASSLFQPTDPIALGLRMLNNVKQHYFVSRDWQAALAIVDYQLALVPGNAGLLLEQGDCWRQLGAPEFARRSFTEALSAAIDQPELAALIRERLQGLKGQDQTLH